MLPFGNLLFIHATTNAIDDHKYSPFPSPDFDIAKVLVSFLELHMLVKIFLLTLRGLFVRLRAPSQSQKDHFSEKTKLKK